MAASKPPFAKIVFAPRPRVASPLAAVRGTARCRPPGPDVRLSRARLQRLSHREGRADNRAPGKAHNGARRDMRSGAVNRPRRVGSGTARQLYQTLLCNAERLKAVLGNVDAGAGVRGLSRVVFSRLAEANSNDLSRASSTCRIEKPSGFRGRPFQPELARFSPSRRSLRKRSRAGRSCPAGLGGRETSSRGIFERFLQRTKSVHSRKISTRELSSAGRRQAIRWRFGAFRAVSTRGPRLRGWTRRFGGAPTFEGFAVGPETSGGRKPRCFRVNLRTGRARGKCRRWLRSGG